MDFWQLALSIRMQAGILYKNAGFEYIVSDLFWYTITTIIAFPLHNLHR